MQFWPLGLAVLASGALALCVLALMMKVQKPDVRGISPHHRWNAQTDLANADGSAGQVSRDEAKPVDDKSATMDQLRRHIGSDGASNTAGSPAPAPAASPLGTDDEAAGATPTSERVEMAQAAEERIKAAAQRK